MLSLLVLRLQNTNGVLPQALQSMPTGPRQCGCCGAKVNKRFGNLGSEQVRIFLMRNYTCEKEVNSK